MNGGTVPPDLVATILVPYILILNKQKKLIVLLELTAPFHSSLNSFKSAEDRKTDRYDWLTLNGKALGYMALNMPLEIGFRGVTTAGNHTVLASVYGMCGLNDIKNLRGNI